MVTSAVSLDCFFFIYISNIFKLATEMLICYNKISVPATCIFRYKFQKHNYTKIMVKMYVSAKTETKFEVIFGRCLLKS